jgi:hypothetical protein
MQRALFGTTLLVLLGPAIALPLPMADARAVNGLTMMKRDLCHSFKLDCRTRRTAPPARHTPAPAKPSRARQATTQPAKPAAGAPIPVARPAPPAASPAPVEAAQPAAPRPRMKPAAPRTSPAGGEAPAAAPADLTPIPRERPALLPSLPPVAGGGTAPAGPAAKTPPARTASIAPGATTSGPPGCQQALRSARVAFDSVPASFGKPGCPIADPVRLHGVETPSGVVRFPEGPVFSCRFARQFASWVSDTGSAVVLAQMNRRLETVATGPGYDCRHRNGDSSAKMSEHASGDAVDITSMTLQDGTAIRMADAMNPAAPAYAVLRALRTTACGYFTTVLGPGANAAHREHFHLDLGIHGKSASYRICE